MSHAGRGPTGPQQRTLASLSRQLGRRYPYPPPKTSVVASELIAAMMKELGIKPKPKPAPVVSGRYCPGAADVEQLVSRARQALAVMKAADRAAYVDLVLERLAALPEFEVRLRAQAPPADEESEEQ